MITKHQVLIFEVEKLLEKIEFDNSQQKITITQLTKMLEDCECEEEAKKEINHLLNLHNQVLGKNEAEIYLTKMIAKIEMEKNNAECR